MERRVGALHELATDDGGCKFARETIVNPLQLSNRNSLEKLDTKGRRADKPLETRNRHLVESPFHFPEARSAVVPEVRSPPNQSGLREHQVRPRKNRKEVASVGVVPGRAKAGCNKSSRPERIVHKAKNSSGITEVLEAVDGNNRVGYLIRLAIKKAPVAHSSVCRLFPGALEQRFSQVNTDHLLGPLKNKFNCFIAFAAAEVDDNFPLH